MTLETAKELRSRTCGSKLKNVVRYAVYRVAGITFRGPAATKRRIREPDAVRAFLDLNFVRAVVEEHHEALYTLSPAVRAKMVDADRNAADAAARGADKTYTDVTRMIETTYARSIIYRRFVSDKWDACRLDDEAMGAPASRRGAHSAEDMLDEELSRGERVGEVSLEGDAAELKEAAEAAENVHDEAEGGDEEEDDGGGEVDEDERAEAEAADAAAGAAAAAADAEAGRLAAVLTYVDKTRPSPKRMSFTRPVIAVSCKMMSRSMTFDRWAAEKLLDAAGARMHAEVAAYVATAQGAQYFLDNVFDINGPRRRFTRFCQVVTNGVTMSAGFNVGDDDSNGVRTMRHAYWAQPQNRWGRPGGPAAEAAEADWGLAQAEARRRAAVVNNGRSAAEIAAAEARAVGEVWIVQRPRGPRDAGGRTRAMALEQVRNGGRCGAFDPGLKNILTWFELAPEGPRRHGFSNRLTQDAYYRAMDSTGRARRARARLRALGDDIFETLSRVSSRASDVSEYAAYAHDSQSVLERVMAEKNKPFWANEAFRAWRARRQCLDTYIADVTRGHAQNMTWGLRPVMYHGDAKFSSSRGGMRSSPTVAVARALAASAGAFVVTITEHRSTMTHSLCGLAMHEIWAMQYARPVTKAARLRERDERHLARTAARLGLPWPRRTPRAATGWGKLHGQLCCSNPACRPEGFPYAIVPRDGDAAHSILVNGVSLATSNLLPLHARRGTPRMPRPASRFNRLAGYMTYQQGVDALW